MVSIKELRKRYAELEHKEDVNHQHLMALSASNPKYAELAEEKAKIVAEKEDITREILIYYKTHKR